MNVHQSGIATASLLSTKPASLASGEYYRISLQHLQSGDLVQAESNCSEGLAVHPHQAELLHLMGTICLLNKDYAAATAWCKRAVAQVPGARYFATLGTALQEQGDIELAIKTFEQALRLDPENAAIWEGFADAFERGARPVEAKFCHERASLIARTFQELPFLANRRSTPRSGWNASTAHYNPHLQSRSNADKGRDAIHCFWSGAPLAPMSQLSLQSMVRLGHPVTLYTYDNMKEMQACVPHGVVLADAETIVPRSIYDQTVATSEIRYFSDIFRYAVLYEHGGWWLDTDIVLVKPLNFETGHVFSSQWSGVENGHVCVGDVMRAPKGSRHMANLYRMSLQRLFNEKRLEYGAVGPLLLSEYLLLSDDKELLSSILPPTNFNAIDWREAELLASDGRAGFEILSDSRVTGVHLWGKMWAEKGLRFDAAADRSVVGYLKHLVLGPNWLTELAAKYGSDKGAVYKGHLAHHYTRIYHELFRTKTLEPLRILEIGLCRGRVEGWEQDQVPSLQMWLDYFPNAEVIGADIEDFSWFSHPRVRVHRVDQGNRKMLTELGEREKAFDIIIDDGSHASVHQHLTLGVLFPYLKPGGLFVIEDLDWQPAEIPSNSAPLVKDALFALRQTGTLVSNIMTQAEAKLIADEVDEVMLNDSFRELTTRGQLGGLGVLRRRQQP
jgi:tetratricopeptide (TPR) repeat protein